MGAIMTDQERKNVISAMSDNFDKQDKPKVGIFWYNCENNELFGVSKINAEELMFNNNGLKTIGLLHKDWWKKERDKLFYRKKPLGIYGTDYTQIPRGRIFQREKDGVFQLMCGNWITDEIENLVKLEFDLNNVPFERVIDTHWDLGHGWSEEYTNY